MLDPFVTLSEAGFSAKDGASLIGPGIWTSELIVSLDWLRLAEVVRAIASHAGCELAGSRVLQDGALLFGMIERPTTSHPQRALVKLSAWNEWGATPESVAHFAREVGTARNTRGILISPAGFSSAARLAAQEHRIEAVDAQALCAVLTSLPQERSDLFYTIATAGLHTTPSCPICLAKMEKVAPVGQGSSASIQVIAERGLFAEPIRCDLLDIAPGAEVEFLYPVQARAMRVSGHAAGDFSCQGTVTIQAGGLLDGRVAAKAVNVLDGGELRGQFRILDGEKVEPFVQPPECWHWACRNPEGKPECRDIIFEPHG